MQKTLPIVIRGCKGNTAAWGAFIDNANEWCMGTSLSVDGLLSLLKISYKDKAYRATWQIRIEMA